MYVSMLLLILTISTFSQPSHKIITYVHITIITLHVIITFILLFSLILIKNKSLNRTVYKHNVIMKVLNKKHMIMEV